MTNYPSEISGSYEYWGENIGWKRLVIEIWQVIKNFPTAKQWKMENYSVYPELDSGFCHGSLPSPSWNIYARRGGKSVFSRGLIPFSCSLPIGFVGFLGGISHPQDVGNFFVTILFKILISLVLTFQLQKNVAAFLEFSITFVNVFMFLSTLTLFAFPLWLYYSAATVPLELHCNYQSKYSWNTQRATL